MLKNLFIAISATYVVMLSFPLLVNAQGSQENTQLREVTQSNEEGSMGQASGTLEERLNNVKERVSVQVNEAEQRRIEARCSTAQERINNLRNRLGDSIESRRNAYTGVSSRLNELVAKLQAAGIENTELNLAVAEMEALLNDSRLSVDAYMQNLADITEMDCASDAEGFKALLDDAREKRTAIVSRQSEIQALKNEKLKPALQNIRESLNSTINSQESGE
jgi:hypothetical protein